ncbi:MAG: hypothetical protein MZW92_48120 [Comamonadaceae bacterium]|nr:hypothetical protein [Comamonadaceae bacterium]
MWKYRFFYRDLNNLLITQPHAGDALQAAAGAARSRWHAGCARGWRTQATLQASRARDRGAGAPNMVVVATYWLSLRVRAQPAPLQPSPRCVGAAWRAAATRCWR